MSFWNKLASGLNTVQGAMEAFDKAKDAYKEAQETERQEYRDKRRRELVSMQAEAEDDEWFEWDPVFIGEPYPGRYQVVDKRGVTKEKGKVKNLYKRRHLLREEGVYVPDEGDEFWVQYV